MIIACVAGVRKGRGRELARETPREGGGKRRFVFAIPPNSLRGRRLKGRGSFGRLSRLLIKKITKITQL